MFGDFELREIPLSLKSAAKERERILSAAGLRAETADHSVGIYDSDDTLLATASLSGETVTCVAVDDRYREENLTNTLISAILDIAQNKGIDNPRVFTKPEYERVFRSLGFSLTGRAGNAILMEYDRRQLESYKEYLRSQHREGMRTGCIVMNANPMTLGHLFLIEKSAVQVDHLFVIPVKEDTAAMFSYTERRNILLEATGHIRNVTILEGSRYVISRDTFPTYFMKEVTDATDTHISLDLNIFTTHIAPALGVTTRFAGTEPADPLTARYNTLMKEILPEHGIEFREIPRMEKGGIVISASSVRRMLTEGKPGMTFGIVPHATIPAILSYAAYHALIEELDLTPKPGLVDRNDSGSHTDMDYALMRKSAESLRETFTEIAEASMREKCPDADLLSPVGIRGEKIMMRNTGGVNTHRGALFCIGLAISAAAHILHTGSSLTVESLRATIKRIAESFPRPTDTHGAYVADKFNIPTALDNALDGYRNVFRNLSITDNHRLLLILMSVTEDSNIYYRCGEDTAREVRKLSAALSDNFTEKDLNDLNKEFISRRISPGGSADLLSLSVLIRGLIIPEI